ncbi:MAG: cysteine hydrolase [Gammaproteobacteria bacterium]|nr:cysteine hydrolase [Gammaproteobacteria bacterium]
MKPALILVDLQQDFLGRAGLEPPTASITAQAAALLDGCRRRRVPVIHVQTVIRADGSDRMPHWQQADHWECVEGTPGALPPPALAPVANEQVVRKPMFSGFGNPALDQALRALGVDITIIAGIYLHGCVRSTVLDAYERGYTVWVAGDATGSTEPAHAELSRSWLGARAARFLPVQEILARLDQPGAVASVNR